MKTLLTRTLPLLLCIAAGNVVSWMSYYAGWIAIWTLHTVPAVRAFDAVGSFLIIPGSWVCRGVCAFVEWTSGETQDMVSLYPVLYWGTNGLILGIIFYSIFRAIWTRREARLAAAQDAAAPRKEAKVA